MITFYGIDIGTLSFFAFSFLAGIFLVAQSVFFCSKETQVHRIVRGIIGAGYASLTVLAFLQLKGLETLL